MNSLDDEIRDNIYRLKLAALKERVESDSRNSQIDRDYQSKAMLMNSWMNAQDLERDLEMKQMSMEINAAKERNERLRNKLREQKLQNKLAKTMLVNAPSITERNGPDRFSQYLEMMMVQQVQNQNLLMNQLLLKDKEEKPSQNNYSSPVNNSPEYPKAPPPAYPSIYPIIMPQYPPIDYSRFYPLPPAPKEIPTKPTFVRARITESLFPYPGNEAQQALRQLGLAALFCSILESNYEENPVVLTEKFLFELKIKEIIISIQKCYLKTDAPIFNILKSLIATNAMNYKLLISNGTGDADKESLQQSLNEILQSLVISICEIMPLTGTLGCEGRSILSEILQTNQTFPDQYFLSRELDLIEVDSLNITRNIGVVESKALLLGVFILRALVMTILMKPIEYGWTTYLSTIGKENLRIISSLLVRVYRMIMAELIETKYPSPVIERPPTITSPKTVNTNPPASKVSQNEANNNVNPTTSNRNTANANPVAQTDNQNTANNNPGTSGANVKSPTNQNIPTAKSKTGNSQPSQPIKSPEPPILITESIIELNDYILTDEELGPLLDTIRTTTIFCKTSILNWADAYVTRLRPY